MHLRKLRKSTAAGVYRTPGLSASQLWNMAISPGYRRDELAHINGEVSVVGYLLREASMYVCLLNYPIQLYTRSHCPRKT